MNSLYLNIYYIHWLIYIHDSMKGRIKENLSMINTLQYKLNTFQQQQKGHHACTFYVWYNNTELDVLKNYKAYQFTRRWLIFD